MTRQASGSEEKPRRKCNEISRLRTIAQHSGQSGERPGNRAFGPGFGGVFHRFFRIGCGRLRGSLLSHGTRTHPAHRRRARHRRGVAVQPDQGRIRRRAGPPRGQRPRIPTAAGPRPDPARPDAPGRRRPGADPAAQAGHQHVADPDRDAHRPRRGGGPHRGPGARGRRLHQQAVQPPRGRAARQGGDPRRLPAEALSLVRLLSLPPKLRLAPFWPALAAVATATVLLWSLLPSLLQRTAAVQLFDMLDLLAPIARDRLADPKTNLESWAEQLGADSGVRITLIRRDGVVLADSSVEPEHVRDMQNHRNRPEVRAAFASGRGMNVRRSATTGNTYVYVARTLSGPG